jgi:hypothetical protein
MKTPSQKLFNLVKKMTASEKRYAKLNLAKSQASDDKYILLFDAIDKQKVYDDAKLQRKIYPNERIESKKFIELKNYLYLSLLRILQDFDKDTTIDYRLRNMLGNIRVLYRRALYQECFDHIQRTRKLADIYEEFEVLIELLRWEKQIAHTKGDINFFATALENINQQEADYYEKLANITIYKNIFYETYATIRRQGLLGHEKTLQTLAQTMQHEVMQKEENALSRKAKILYFRTKSIYAYALLDQENFYQHSRQLLYLMESNEAFISEETNEYISAVSNFIASCFSTNRLEEANEMIEKLKQITPRTYDDAFKIYRQYYQSKFTWCTATGAFTEGLKVIKEQEKEKENFENQESINSIFYYPYFYITFGAEKFDDAHTYLNEWLSTARTKDREDLNIMARVLNLILHFEMGNTTLLDSLLKSTTSYISRHASVTAFERLLFRFIREAYHSTSKSELKGIARELKQQFENITQDSTQSIFTQYFDFLAWIESKITGKRFASIVQAKMKGNQ